MLARNIIWLRSALGKIFDVGSLRYFIYVYVCIYEVALQLLYRHFSFLNDLPLPFRVVAFLILVSEKMMLPSCNLFVCFYSCPV